MARVMLRDIYFYRGTTTRIARLSKALPKALIKNKAVEPRQGVPMKKLLAILFVEPGFGWMAITIFGSVYVLYSKTGFWLN
jgi:hypothetical protein